MADEARVISSLYIRITDTNENPILEYQSRPDTFTADVNLTKGPTPGAFTVTPVGVDVDLSQLTTPALCRIMNLDDTDWVEYGVSDGSNFFPFGEVLPGESYVVRLSRNLGHSFSVTGTGTGTNTTGTTMFYIRSYNQPVNALVEAFEA